MHMNYVYRYLSNQFKNDYLSDNVNIAAIQNILFLTDLIGIYVHKVNPLLIRRHIFYHNVSVSQNIIMKRLNSYFMLALSMLLLMYVNTAL